MLPLLLVAAAAGCCFRAALSTAAAPAAASLLPAVLLLLWVAAHACWHSPWHTPWPGCHVRSWRHGSVWWVHARLWLRGHHAIRWRVHAGRWEVSWHVAHTVPPVRVGRHMHACRAGRESWAHAERCWAGAVGHVVELLLHHAGVGAVGVGWGVAQHRHTLTTHDLILHITRMARTSTGMPSVTMVTERLLTLGMKYVCCCHQGVGQHVPTRLTQRRCAWKHMGQAGPKQHTWHSMHHRQQLLSRQGRHHCMLCSAKPGCKIHFCWALTC